MKLSSTRNAAFHCAFTRVAPDTECYRLKVLASELEVTVLKQIQEQAQAILLSVDGSTSKSNPKTDMDGQTKQIEDAKLALYEKYVIREIAAEEYKAEKAVLDVELEQAKNAQVILAKEAAQKASVAGLRQIAEDTLKAKTLSKSITDVLIDKILVFPGGRVEIVTKIMQ